MHVSVLKLVNIHSELPHVSANHVLKFKVKKLLLLLLLLLLLFSYLLIYLLT